MKSEYFIHRVPDNKIVKDNIRTMHDAKENLKLIENGFPFQEFAVGERRKTKSNTELFFKIKTN